MQHWFEAGFRGVDRDVFGYPASALVLATFSMKSMRWLRVAAIGSNISFILYAWVAGLNPMLVLHCLLLPLNVFRLIQITATAARRRLDAAALGAA